MFITKKKFEEEIYKAKAETEKEMWERERLERMEHNINERIDRLERRVFELERDSGHYIKGNKEVTTCVPRPY